MKSYLLAIPFYKNEEFIEAIIAWYISKYSIEDRDLIYKVIVYNDFPHSEKSAYLKNKCIEAGFDYIENNENIGYLRTVNNAYALAKKSKVNLLLLNSDTIPFSGFIKEVDECFAADSMLGVVSSRSNNATICNLYDEVSYFEGEKSIDKYKLDHSKFIKYIPSISYAPVVTGFCFAIHHKLIHAFNGFDEIYTVGYEEENDYCLRVSERGYRVGIANKAFVVHMEGKSFGLTSSRDTIRNGNARIVRERWPYYESLITNYADSLRYQCESKISKAISNGVSYLIDARVMSACHNGSNKLILEILKAFSDQGLTADVIASPDAIAFHSLNNFGNLNLIKNVEAVYEYGFMLGQPMLHETLCLVPSHSLMATCIFFDTIAHDCPQLRTENTELDSIWELMTTLYSDISFISHHSRKQFELKFGQGSSSLHSHLLPAMFEILCEPKGYDSKTVLVIGNKFTHKGVDLLLKELPEDNEITYYVLGQEVVDCENNLIFLRPGETDSCEMDSIMKSVDYIIMPSFAEGFGFPLLEAVAYSKPIFCRNIDCYKEIILALPGSKRNLIHLVEDFTACDLIYKSYVTSVNLGANQVDNNYISYVAALLNDVKNKSSDSFFNSFKIRVRLLNAISSPATNFKNKLNIIQKLYRMALNSKLQNYAIKIRLSLFKSNIFVAIWKKLA